MECFRIVAEKTTEGASKQKSPICIINEILQKLPYLCWIRNPCGTLQRKGMGNFVEHSN
jgi:hypothetical protein